MPDTLFLLQQDSFQAARRLDAPAGHREARLHGHAFSVLHCVPPSAAADLPRLAARAAAWDYQDLNAMLAAPTDARLLARLGDPGHAGALSAAPRHGVRRDAGGRWHAWRAYRFESSHHLPHVPPGHKCGRLHGHGFQAVIHVPLQSLAAGWNADYARLDAGWAPIHAQLQGRCLNALPGLENPTSEWLAAWLWQQLRVPLPDLAWVTVYETASCGAHFDGAAHRIWKDFSIDSAAWQDGCQAGHSWTIRLHLQSALHPVFGWALDFADVKREFDPLFRCLDHQPLHALEGLASPDSVGIARWIRQHAPQVLPALGRVDVFDGCGGGASLDWAAGGLQALP